MNRICLIGLSALAACAQLKHGQMQPVLAKDLKQNIWVTNCGGGVETWGSCYDKAKDKCDNNYSVVNRSENTRGTTRELTFQCKTKTN